MASKTSTILFVFLLTCSQDLGVAALPTGHASFLPPTPTTNKTASRPLWNVTVITQYPPTTTVQNTVPETKGVSLFQRDIAPAP